MGSVLGNITSAKSVVIKPIPLKINSPSNSPTDSLRLSPTASLSPSGRGGLEFPPELEPQSQLVYPAEFRM
ncbi:MAG: hypothetical protein JSV62_14875 [Promethearchaeota archaeon]|nr:MAG: hypothetical protein JSV62_14875 [Candidatus Lokiarchaeota archaeon]